MTSQQIIDLLYRHDRTGLALVGDGEILGLDGDRNALVRQLLRLANLGAALEKVFAESGPDASVQDAKALARANWPARTP